MNYRQAWDFLDNLQFFKIKLGLDSMSMFLDELDRPQHQLQFVHIAGTNGKGSVAVTLLTLLAKAGYRVGLYTSPHLISVRERFRINDSFISEEEFAVEAGKIHGILAGRQITYFEFTTALALLWFVSRKVDLAIMEVGLGGRLDATNVIRPLASIITNVTMDHEAYLGTSISEVAREKAGIIKPKVPVVCGVEPNEFDTDGVALRVIEDVCRSQTAPLYLHGRDFLAEPVSGGWNYWGMKRRGCCRVRERLNGLVCNMTGEHQATNAALALAALEILAPLGFTVSEQAIRLGLSEAFWPGRLEYFCLSSATGEKADCTDSHARRYLLDGAHNPAGVRTLKKALQDNYDYKNLILVWGAMSDKDSTATLPDIAPLAARIILTKQRSDRSADPEALMQLLPSYSRECCLCIPSVAGALNKAAGLATPDDLICIAGSLYLVGEARGILRGETW